MKLLALTGVILTLMVFSALPARAVTDDSGGIRGTVTEIGDSEVLIEANPDEKFGSDKSYVRITPDTRIRKQSDGDRIAARFEDLAVGSRVEARFSGPVAESYPTQATAASIVILDAGSGDLPGTGGPNPALFGLGFLLAGLLAAGLFRGRLIQRL